MEGNPCSQPQLPFDEREPAHDDRIEIIYSGNTAVHSCDPSCDCSGEGRSALQQQEFTQCRRWNALGRTLDSWLVRTEKESPLGGSVGPAVGGRGAVHSRSAVRPEG